MSEEISKSNDGPIKNEEETSNENAKRGLDFMGDDDEKNEKNDKKEYKGPTKLPNNQKYEEFDFYEVTADISNSITDKLYRSYLPIVEKEYRRRQDVLMDESIKNDLNVDDIVEKIRADLAEKISGKITDQLIEKISSELDEQYHPKIGSWEHWVDRSITFIRWLMLPAFICVAFVILSIIFLVATEVYNIGFETLTTAGKVFYTETPLEELKLEKLINKSVAGILAVMDLILLGSLVIMVLIGGYENTISRIGITHDVPTWFGKLNIAELKIKVAASIVIISSIHLLMVFMQIDIQASNEINFDAVMWTAIIHMVFVAAALGLAYMDTFKEHNKNKKSENGEVALTTK